MPRSRRLPLFSLTGFAAIAGTVRSSSAQTPTTAQEIFTPTQGDMALDGLRKLAGCVVDGVWKSTEMCSDDRPLTVALAYFNIACLIVAAAIGMYLLYSLIADTANDGEVFGRSVDAKYTLLRVGAGAILALPLKNGLSLIQLIVIQVAVWSSGAADTLWQKVSETGLNGMYGSMPPIEPRVGDYKLRGNMAETLRMRVYGFVCKGSLEAYSKTLSGTRKPVNVNIATFQEADATSVDIVKTYHFVGDAYFRSSDNMCGAVSYHYSKVDPKIADTDGNLARKIITSSQTLVEQAIERSMEEIDRHAQNIAQKILGRERDEQDIKTDIRTGVDSAVSQITNAISSLANNGAPEFRQTVREYLDQANQAGWVSSVLWQRSTAAIYARMINLPDAIRFEFTAPPEISRYIPIFSRSGSAYRSLVDKAERDFAYLAGFDGYFATLGQPGPAGIASDQILKEQNEEKVLGYLIAGLYQGILDVLSQDERSTWRDPIIELQQIGNQIGYWGIYSGMGSAALGLTSFVDRTGISGTLGGFAFATSVILAFIALVLTGLVPFAFVITFFVAVLNWLLAVIEALIAVPVWLLTKFFPAHTQSFVGVSRFGYVHLLSILLRPVLAVIGLIAAILFLRVGLDLLNYLFRGALALLAPDGSLVMIMIGVAGILVYAALATCLVILSALFICDLPNRVMVWIGHQTASLGTEQMAHMPRSMLPASPTSFGSAASRTLRTNMSSRRLLK